MKLLKLKPAWKLTDEEYVERVRVARHRFRRWQRAARILWLLVVLAMFPISFMMVDVALDHPDKPDGAKVGLAYFVGGPAGWLMGFTLLQAVFFNAETWTMERAYRIMLTSWDRSKELENLIDSPSSDLPQATSRPDGSAAP